MGTGPKLRVDALPKRPPAISFVSSALDLSPSDLRFGNGLTFRPEQCVLGGTAVPCGSARVVSLDDNQETVEVEAFSAWAGVACSTFSGPEYANVEQKAEAQRALAACESRQVAREFWEGTLAQAEGWDNFYLRQPGATVVTDVAGHDPYAALACLEAALDSCVCGEGVIHMTRQVATYLLHDDVIERSGNMLQTRLGTRIITDRGYTGTAPEGVGDATDVSWMYATGLVGYYRAANPRFLSANLVDVTNRDDNTVYWIAERPYAIQTDECCHFAAAAAITGCVNLVFGS